LKRKNEKRLEREKESEKRNKEKQKEIQDNRMIKTSENEFAAISTFYENLFNL
jgi:hypothetical protein